MMCLYCSTEFPKKGERSQFFTRGNLALLQIARIAGIFIDIKEAARLRAKAGAGAENRR